jgi:hypothetical protein
MLRTIGGVLASAASVFSTPSPQSQPQPQQRNHNNDVQEEDDDGDNDVEEEEIATIQRSHFGNSRTRATPGTSRTVSSLPIRGTPSASSRRSTTSRRGVNDTTIDRGTPSASSRRSTTSRRGVNDTTIDSSNTNSAPGILANTIAVSNPESAIAALFYDDVEIVSEELYDDDDGISDSAVVATISPAALGDTNTRNSSDGLQIEFNRLSAA